MKKPTFLILVFMLTASVYAQKISRNYYSNGQLSSTGMEYEERGTGFLLKTGEWKYYYDNGQLESVGSYSNGNMTGHWLYYYKDGNLKESENLKSYSNSYGDVFYSRYGEYKLYHEGGYPNEIGNYNDEGKPHGLWKFYYNKDGIIREEGYFVNGSKTGEWKNYDSKGKVLSKGALQDNRKTGKWQFYHDNGAVYWEGDFVDDQKTGLWKKYYKNGQLKAQGTLLDYRIPVFQMDDYIAYYENGSISEKFVKRNERVNYTVYYKNSQPALSGDVVLTQKWNPPKTMEDLVPKQLIYFEGILSEYDNNGVIVNKALYKEGKTNDIAGVIYSWDNWAKLNEYAWNSYEGVSEKEKLLFALKWAERSIELDRNNHNVDTYAALLYKTGDYKKALTMALEAIKLAKETGADHSATTKLLIEIRQKLETPN